MKKEFRQSAPRVVNEDERWGTNPDKWTSGAESACEAGKN